MSWLSKAFRKVTKVFKPKNLLRIAGAVLGGIPGYMLTNSLIKKQEQKALPAPQTVQAPPAPVPQTTNAISRTGYADQLQPVGASVYNAPAIGYVPEMNTPTQSSPQQMKLQNTQSPYVAGLSAFNQQQQQQPTQQANTFAAPSLQWIQFGGS